MEKRKRKELTLKEKVELINQSAGKSQRLLAQQFGIGKTQVQTILKRKAEFMEGYESNIGGDRKRLCSRSPVDQVNSLMWDWFQKARGNGVAISGPMLQEKALSYAKELGIAESDFKASTGWLNRFRQSHNISFLSVCGEGASVSQETVSDWCDRLPDIVKGYHPRDIFNMDETGLFFRALPDKSLSIRGEDCKGGKKSKDRLTVSLCVIMLGQFEKPLVIGKAAKPRCFRNIKIENLPVTWCHNKKAWMTTSLFTDWIKTFNDRMRRSGRSVLLLLDNAPSHPPRLTLSNVKLVFLPANTTSKLQPLDQGIIQNVKQFYRKRLLRSVLAKIDDDSVKSADEIAKCVNVLNAVQWVSAAVNDVQSETVVKCFRKSGLSESVVTNGEPDVNDDDDDDDVPISELVELMRAANNKINVNEKMTPEEYLNLDRNIVSNEELSDNWETELLASHVNVCMPDDDDIDDDDDETVEPDCTITSHVDAVKCVEQLKLFCMQKGLTSVLDAFNSAQDELEKQYVAVACAARQTTIDSFFRK